MFSECFESRVVGNVIIIDVFALGDGVVEGLLVIPHS